ncbi:hypothetical protein MGYG_05123 [Nannizzia gypsea CBS 118893]|uniref:Uncharacterized protein n=1 Tax=Arthroderma gypseum (strain ATCC MYA-4604 / CBS 118893) TaxID=535722 RepID=E4UYF8_ARTGP|nr:hypothetical protein MGYG_05123 [Nannizzia gypsea CBS 118893]EFR02121.1 hypothetical protein MGYG_05123 [Nannizzia gypsea CBS 118893]
MSFPSPTSSMRAHHGSPPHDPREVYDDGASYTEEGQLEVSDDDSEDSQPSESNYIEETLAEITQKAIPKTGAPAVVPESDPSGLVTHPRKRRRRDTESSGRSVRPFPGAHGRELAIPASTDEQQPGGEPDDSPNEEDEVEAAEADTEA